MTRSMSRASLFALALAVPACSLPVEAHTVAGPAFMLTADEPVAAFEVTLCVDGPKVKHAYVSAQLDLTARATSTRPLRLDVTSLQAEDEALQLELSPGAEEEDSLWMDAEGSFEPGGRRCGEPQVVEFSVDTLGELDSIEVARWDVTMRVEWEGERFGGHLDDADLSVEIVRL